MGFLTLILSGRIVQVLRLKVRNTDIQNEHNPSPLHHSSPLVFGLKIPSYEFTDSFSSSHVKLLVTEFRRMLGFIEKEY